MSYSSLCPFSFAYNIILHFYGTFFVLQYNKTNVTLQNNQCPMDTVNTPRIVVKNTGRGTMSVSHNPNQVELITLSNVEQGAHHRVQH